MFWNGPLDWICCFDVLLSFCHNPCCITSHHVATSMGTMFHSGLDVEFGGIDGSRTHSGAYCIMKLPRILHFATSECVKPNWSGAGDLGRGTCSLPDFFKCWFCTVAGHGGTWFREWRDLKRPWWQDSSKKYKKSCIATRIMIVVC